MNYDFEELLYSLETIFNYVVKLINVSLNDQGPIGNPLPPPVFKCSYE